MFIYTDEDDRETLELIYNQYPFLEEAIKYIGFKGIVDTGYVIANVKRKLLNYTSDSEDNKVYKALKSYSCIFIGSVIPDAKLKQIFTKIYSDLDVRKSPKGSDINKYFFTESKRIWEDGVQIRYCQF